MKQTFAIALMIICLLFCSQAFSQRIDKEAIPSDYNCTGCILVILKQEPNNNPHKLNDMIQEKLIGNYDGKAVFITADDLGTNDLYKDENVYRFVLAAKLVRGQGSMPVTKANGSQGNFNYSVTGINVHLYDRVTKKDYTDFFDRLFSWSKQLKAVAEGLNKALKK